MPTNFPTSQDDFTNPISNDSLNNPSHSLQHTNNNDAIEAIEASLLPGGVGYGGLVHLRTNILTSVTFVHIDSIFSSTYDAYQINLSLTGGSAAVVATSLRAGGVPLASAVYNTETLSATNAAVSAAVLNNQTSWGTGAVRTGRQAYEFKIYEPANPALTTNLNAVINDWGSASSLQIITGWYAATGAVDGFRVSSSATMTGTIAVYGYRK